MKGVIRNQPVLSIIIANWNTQDLIKALLSSIYSHSPNFPNEVIVVENGSTDASATIIEREFPDVRLLRNPTNLGYARANNQGYAASRGKYILLLGSDTVIVDGSIQRMVEYMESHSATGAVGCRLLSPDGSLQKSCKRFPTVWDGALTYLSLHGLARRYNMAGFDYYTTQEVDQPPATCLMIKRQVVEQIGLFDERFTILYNDVDLCKRIWGGGWKIVYLGDAEVVHHGSYTTRRAPPEVRLEMYRNILLYYFRQFGILAVIILLPILTLRLAVVNRGRLLTGLFSLRYLS